MILLCVGFCGRSVGHQYRAKSHEERAKEPAAHRLADATWAIVFLTLGLIGVGVSQWWVLSGQQGVMQRQLDEMRDEQRPWIRFTNANSMIINSPFDFDESGGHINIKFN
jgi:hypothetical protein